MGWFGNTVINHTELSTTEVRIVAGAAVVLVVIVVLYMCLRVHNKFTKASTRKQVQQEVRFNNLKVDV